MFHDKLEFLYMLNDQLIYVHKTIIVSFVINNSSQTIRTRRCHVKTKQLPKGIYIHFF